MPAELLRKKSPVGCHSGFRAPFRSFSPQQCAHDFAGAASTQTCMVEQAVWCLSLWATWKLCGDSDSILGASRVQGVCHLRRSCRSKPWILLTSRTSRSSKFVLGAANWKGCCGHVAMIKSMHQLEHLNFEYEIENRNLKISASQAGGATALQSLQFQWLYSLQYA